MIKPAHVTTIELLWIVPIKILIFSTDMNCKNSLLVPLIFWADNVVEVDQMVWSLLQNCLNSGRLKMQIDFTVKMVVEE